MTNNTKQSSRRAFLGCGSARLALAAGASLLLARPGRAADRGRNPFAYDVERYRRTDPALVAYDRVKHFPSPRPEPRRVGIGPDDRLHLAAGNAIAVLDGEGRVTSEIRCGGVVHALAVSAEGTVYAGLRDHLEVFDPKGKRLAAWATPEGRPFLTGLAVGESDVFVADAGNRVVWRHDLAGNRLGTIGRRDPDRNIPGIVLPSPVLDVAIGRDGLLRVNNAGRHRVELYTFDGGLELFWGRFSMAMEGFSGCCNPVGLALLEDGRTVTFEKGLPRVKIYEATGRFESVVAGTEMFADTGSAAAIARPDDRVYSGLDGVVDSAGRVIILDPLGADLHVMQRRSDQADAGTPAPAKGTTA
jgi:hypothetical protein